MFVVELTRGRGESEILDRIEFSAANLYLAVERATKLFFNAENDPDGYRVLDYAGRVLAEFSMRSVNA